MKSEVTAQSTYKLNILKPTYEHFSRKFIPTYISLWQFMR